jgi:hypothetical protein
MNIYQKIRGSNDSCWCWTRNGLLHREDGPAIIDNNGDKFWMINDKPHRLDGPAAEFADGGQEWFVDGKHIKCSSQEEFERILKLKLYW